MKNAKELLGDILDKSEFEKDFVVKKKKEDDEWSFNFKYFNINFIKFNYNKYIKKVTLIFVKCQVANQINSSLMEWNLNFNLIIPT